MTLPSPRPMFGVWTAAILIPVTILSLLPLPSPPAYAAVFLGASLIYLILARALFHASPDRRTVLALLLLSVAVRAAFLTSAPIGSDDVYRYMWDGKVHHSGIDPYRYAPNDPALQELHTAALPSLVNHPDMRTIYFPFTQWFFSACYAVSGEAIWGYKALLLFAEALTIAALALMAGRHGGGNKFALLYALCPLPILQFALDAHIDALGLPLLAWGLLWYLDGKKGRAYVLIGLSMSVKPVALVLLPLFFLHEKGVRNRLAAVLVPLTAFAVQFVPYLFASHLFEALTTFTRHWVFNGALFEVVNFMIADNQRSRAVCAIVLAASLALLYMGRSPLKQKVSHAVLLLLLCSPVVHPWYVAWLAVLIPLVPMRSAIVFAATASLTAFTILTYKQTGVWQQYPIAMAFEYIPVAAVLAWEAFAMTRTQPAA